MIGDVALIALFILIGGTFAAAEMALVTLRESQVQQLAAKGKRGQAIGRLTSNPNLFLSSVQIGVTLSGFLSAAFGGATLADNVAPMLTTLGVPQSIARTTALVLVTVIISYFSIVVGELTAKRLAMQRAESFALFLAPLVNMVPSEAAAPALFFVGFLMMSQVTHVDWDDPEEGIPAFLTMALMPFTYSITAGIGAGFISYTLIKLINGKASAVHPLMYLVAGLFVIYFAQGALIGLLG